MKLVLPILLFALALPSPQTASADDDSPNMLFDGSGAALIWSVHNIKLRVHDDVRDGCLPHPNDMKRTAEAALRRNNFNIIDDDSTTSQLVFNALGYESVSERCAVYFEVFLQDYRLVSVPYSSNLDSSLQNTVAPLRWGIYGTLLTGPKSTMQSMIEDEAEQAANEFFIQIDRSRDHIKKNWPILFDKWNSARNDE